MWRWSAVVICWVAIAACRSDDPELGRTGQPLAFHAGPATDLSLQSRGGGNGTVDRTGTELGCWNLTGDGGYQSQPIVRFADLRLPRGARITGATLRLVFANWGDGFTVRGRYLMAAWDPAWSGLGWQARAPAVSWAQPGARGEGTDVVADRSFSLTQWGGTGADVQAVALDLAMVQRWVDDPASNLGIVLINETPDAVTRLYSSRHPHHAPTLELHYVVDAEADDVVDAGAPVTVTFQDGLDGYAGTRSVSIYSRGGGNGESDRTGTELACWSLTGANGYRAQPLIRFTDLALPPGARVTAAALTMQFATWDRDFTVRGRYLAAPWSHDSPRLGWLHRDAERSWAQPGAAGEGSDRITGPSFALTGWAGQGDETRTVALDVGVVQAWIDEPARNHGVILINETDDAVVRLRSSRHASGRPSLAITYVLPGDGGGDGGPSPDIEPPTVTLTAPTAGPPLTGLATLTASVSDDVGVTDLQFLIDGVPVGAAQTATTLTIDSTALANASHDFAVWARDAAGNSAISAVVARAVSNPPGLDARVANPTCTAPPRPPAPATGTLALRPVFPALSTGGGGPFGNHAPIVARRVLMPGGERLWFIGLRNGRVFQVSDVAATSPPATNLLDPFVPASRDLSGGEEGLLGLAFDPDLASDPQRNHVYTVRGGWGSVGLYRATVTRDAGGIYVAANPELILSAGAGGHHYGGDVQFGPDGFLYLSVGEDEIFARTRSPSNLRGKVLRIDVHAATPLPGKRYGIPADNPYRLDGAGAAQPPCFEQGDAQLPDASHPCPEVWARGFRNPFRFSFDRQGGALWLGDVGAASEEIDLVGRDGDFGWDTQEGTTTPGGGITAAVAEVPRGGSSCAGNAIIGGFVYRGAAIPWLTGTYVAADNGNGKLYLLDRPYHPQRTLEVGLAGACAQFNPASFTEDEDGELYVVALNPGAGLGVWQLVAGSSSPPPGAGGPAGLLSATGCVQASAPAQPIAAAVPYQVNAALWADGLAKRRWMILPDGGTIGVTGDGDWSFPIGTVLLKELSAGARRIETRMLVRHSDGDWAGYTYVWNAAQTDAVLASDRQSIDLGDGGPPWTVPSRDDCLACHTTAKGRSLGLETRQLNRASVYPNGRRANQLVTLAHLGLLDAGYADPRAFGQLPDPDGAGDLAGRARAYLHANCSHCHPGPGTAPDLRFETGPGAMRVCDATPTTPVPGGVALVAPGNAAGSVLALRMRSANSLRMPRLGSARVDPAGVATVEAWIDAMSGCPAPSIE